MREKIFFNMGKWNADYDENGNCTNVVYSEEYLRLLKKVDLDVTKFKSAWRKIIHPDDIEIVDKMYEDILSKHPEGMDYDLECRFLVDGEYHWFHDFGHCTRRDDGSLIRIDGVLFDIQGIEDSKKAQNMIIQNHERLFALEDNFEALYDVDLSSGFYVSYSKDNFYQRNVSDLVVSDTEFFNDLRANVDRVVYEEDRDAVYEFQTRETIIKNLSINEHADIYYRIITESGLMWLKMRIVYKDSSKKNVIIGIFNAEEEMRIKTKETNAKEELRQTNARLFALEDNFESMYDVNLESGKYDVFVKGDFYNDNVINKLSEPGDYFKELKGNIEAVVYEEDQEGLINILSKNSMIDKLSKNDYFDYYYRLKSDSGIVWFKMRVVYKDADKKNVIIGVFNASSEIAAKEKEEKLIENIELQLQHEKLRTEMLSYMLNHDDDPIELLKQFAVKLRDLLNCDQVIYRDLEETRIMVNSEEIKDDWSVPIEYCRQCEHFDAFHSMYDGGYTEMSNCQEGWQGIPVYHKCPIKSSLTRIVYCDDERAGYLAIHYTQKYHEFNDLERYTLEVFERILSISISRYKAKEQARELGGVKRSLNMMFSLSDEFDPIIVLDPATGEYDWFQSKAQEIEEKTSMSVHGENLYKNIEIDSDTIIHKDDREQYKAFYTKENMMKIARTGESQIIENRWRVGEKGEYLWKYNKAVRMVDENGKVLVAVGVIDTTEKKRKEEQLQEAYKKLEDANRRSVLLHKAVKASIWSYVIDKNSDVIEANYDDYASRTTVKKSDNPMGWLETIHPDDRKRVEAEFMATICDHSCNTPYETTYRIRISNGKYIWVKTSGRLISKDDGNFELFGISVNIDDQIESEREQQRQLEEARNIAQEASKSKSNFLFNMSHDIRTPMNAITGFTNMAKKHIDDKEKVMDALDKIDTSGNQLLNLINQVLEMARIESGKAELEENPIDVKMEYEAAVTVLSEQAKNCGLEFTHNISDIKHNNVYADTARMSSITLNITGNAMKYTPRGGKIEYSLIEMEPRREGYATFKFTVTDTGIGMSDEYLKVLYDPFTRENNSTVSRIQGTGLGMSIVKDLIELMGGEIKVESKVGKGSKFDIIVDFKIVGENDINVNNETIISEASFKGKKLLLVEDNELNREIAIDILEEEGFIIEEAEDGTVAVRLLKEKGPNYYDFILMDIQMPVMSGYEATREIRDMYPNVPIPIIALSANAFSEDREKSIEAGMDEHVAKPIKINELLGALLKFV